MESSKAIPFILKNFDNDSNKALT